MPLRHMLLSATIFLFIVWLLTLAFTKDILIVSTDSNIIIPLSNKEVANGSIVDYSCIVKCSFAIEYPTSTGVHTIHYSQQYVLDNLSFTKAVSH